MAISPEQPPPENNQQQGVKKAPSLVGNNGPKASPGEHAGIVHWPIARGVFFGIVGFVTVAGLFYEGVHWLENRIDESVEKKLSDVAILKKIAAESRPMLVFKGNESIVADEGAMPFVKQLSITKRFDMSKDTTNLPVHLHIEFTKFLPQMPLVSPVSPALCVVTGERGKGLSWEFEMEWSGMAYFEDFGNQVLFRLEILP